MRKKGGKKACSLFPFVITYMNKKEKTKELIASFSPFFLSRPPLKSRRPAGDSRTICLLLLFAPCIKLRGKQKSYIAGRQAKWKRIKQEKRERGQLAFSFFLVLVFLSCSGCSKGRFRLLDVICNFFVTFLEIAQNVVFSGVLM